MLEPLDRRQVVLRGRVVDPLLLRQLERRPLRSLLISLGIASVVPSREDTKERLITRADRSLYQAKTQGRDRVICDQ